MKNKKTVVKGLRAQQSFFNKCDIVAKNQGIDRNKLIIGLVEKYLDKFEWLEATCLNGETHYIYGEQNND